VRSGTRGVGVLVSDTMMFERGDPTPSDSRLGSFYGLAMPLIKRGLPVEPVQIESAAVAKDFLKPYRVLLLTYEGQKPPTPAFHDALAKWVRAGGALIVMDNDGDPYNAVRDWWNKAPLSFKTPRQHLFQTLGLPDDFIGSQKVGNGLVIRQNESPADLSHRKDGGDVVRGAVKQAARSINLPWQESNALVLQRGPYVVASGLDESVPDAPFQRLQGRFIDLFDHRLSVLSQVELLPGKRAYLFDLNASTAKRIGVVAASCRVRDEVVDGRTLRFAASGIAQTTAVVCVVLPRQPKTISVNGQAVAPGNSDFKDGLLHLRFPNSVDGVMVQIGW